MKTDTFTRAYITTALWSSTENPYGECPCCGEKRILSHYPEPEYDQELMCSDCGVRENPNPPPMDQHYSESDISPSALARIMEDCERFQRENANTVAEAMAAGVTCNDAYERAAHDFWLTRNGHGAGFWDGDWPEPYATTLTDASHAFGTCDLYVGDDGQLYIY